MSRLHRRLVDWRFWTAMAGTLLVVWLVVSSAQAFQAKDRQIDALIQDGRETRADFRDSRAQASVERDRLLAQQKRLTRRLDALLAYLDDQGIVLPQDLSSANRSQAPSGDRSVSSPPPNKERPPAADAGGPTSVPPEQTPKPPGRPPQAPQPPAPTPEPGNLVQDLLDQLLGRTAP